jgi:predicted lysophospholipase L1 biosynthesis ABC-type transport system permease subunit
VNRRRRDEDAARRTREVAARAVRRLEVFEWALLAGAVGAALAGGALVAALVSVPLGMPFRLVWAGLSVVLLVVPGGLALRGARDSERGVRPANPNETEKPHV